MFMATTVPLFTPEQVRTADQRSFESGVTAEALMERAAGHLVRGITGLAGYGYGLRVTVLAGKGNNGGDGLAAARRLRDAGAQATVCLVSGEDGLGELGKLQLARWQTVGGRLVGSAAEALATADVAVDCLLGTGASGAPRGAIADAITALDAADIPTVACDLPTGVDADTGRVPGQAVQADLTVTLGAHKRGLWLWPARGHCGRLVLGDLGFLTEAGLLDEPAALALGSADVARLAPPSPPSSHKRSRGVVLVVAGSPNMSGAAVLVARGAMAAGAGLVTVATSQVSRSIVAPTIPEAMTLALDEQDPDGSFDAITGALGGVDCVAVGPGLGHDEAAVTLVRRLVREVDLPIVLDADGINAFRHDGDALADRASDMLVLTPHAKEFGRLVDASGHEVWGSRVARVPDAARRWDATIVAKGPGSLTAAPDGRVWINPTGSAALATGGTGDVLTGMTAALIAQRAESESVAAAVWLHGAAGHIAGTRRTVRPATALDVAESVGEAFREVEGTAGSRAGRAR